MESDKINETMHLNFPEEKLAPRKGYGDALLELGKDKRVVALCADLAESTRVKEFKEKYPQQFIEVGVAEQNLVTVASGLAHVGKIPFASSFAMFCPGRGWEQIRNTIAYNNNNVKLIGSHAGINVGEDGATHQALEDMAIMRVLPNMTVLVPCDYEQTKKATQAMAEFKGPVYLRFGRAKTGQMTTGETPFKIGQAQVFREGKDVALIGAGPVVYECLQAAERLEKKKIKAMVINCHTLKPLDEKTILAAAKKCKKIITIEDGQVSGGLGGAVSEFLSEHYPIPIKRLGVQNQYGESGSTNQLMKKFGLTADDIVREVVELLK